MLRLTGLLLLVSLVPSASRAAACAGPAWLVQSEPAELRTAPAPEPELGASTASGWHTAGAYGLEFGGAVLGTAASYALAASAYHAVERGDPSNEALPGVAIGLAFISAVATNPVLSATGTYFGGSVIGQRGSFWHTLVGTYAGGLAGTAVALGYNNYWTSHHNYYGRTQDIVTLACAIVPTWVGAVVAHEIWR